MRKLRVSTVKQLAHRQVFGGARIEIESLVSLPLAEVIILAYAFELLPLLPIAHICHCSVCLKNLHIWLHSLYTLYNLRFFPEDTFWDLSIWGHGDVGNSFELLCGMAGLDVHPHRNHYVVCDLSQLPTLLH